MLSGPQNTSQENDENASFVDEKALKMMQKMGYKSGSGLGKHAQGIKEIISLPVQLGTRGLGASLGDLSISWDFSRDNVMVPEEVVWLEGPCDDSINQMIEESWLVEQEDNEKNDSHFCDDTDRRNVINAKNFFNNFDLKKIYHARTRSNPFETLRGAFFMNRAALKMANLDAATDFMFSKMQGSEGNPVYFADVCAGPGGFSEYILWRKKWKFKGFGFTLKELDFTLDESFAADSATFQALYGAKQDGDVCSTENIVDFEEKILFETQNGVDFMMSDGGFSVEGNENLQEILSKNIYLCQCLLALKIVKEQGHFVTKLFDVFTLFSVGLVFLLFNCFERITILKPNSSRPANSERYLICKGKKPFKNIEKITDFLWLVAKRFESKKTIAELVPLTLMLKNEQFVNFIKQSNGCLAKKQTVALEKLETFCRNPSLQDPRQEDLRINCLKLWKIPENFKPKNHETISELLRESLEKPEILLVQTRLITTVDSLTCTLLDLTDWNYCFLNSSKADSKNCTVFASLGNQKTFKLTKKKWTLVKNLHLVNGTILYGELVKETLIAKDSKESFKFSLQIIDALRLGDTNLFSFKFEQRMKLIELYAKAVNSEYSGKTRVRAKTMRKLTDFAGLTKLIPNLHCNSSKEFVEVNSILLLKSNEKQNFQTTFVLRAQLFVQDLLQELTNLTNK